MADYDASIIQRFADKLYRQAGMVVALYAILGISLGALAGATAGARRGDVSFAVAGAIIAGLLGFVVGQARAFMLRLQAQTALCQAQIERNTRSVPRH